MNALCIKKEKKREKKLIFLALPYLDCTNGKYLRIYLLVFRFCINEQLSSTARHVAASSILWFASLPQCDFDRRFADISIFQYSWNEKLVLHPFLLLVFPFSLLFFLSLFLSASSNGTASSNGLWATSLSILERVILISDSSSIHSFLLSPTFYILPFLISFLEMKILSGVRELWMLYRFQYIIRAFYISLGLFKSNEVWIL